MSTLNIFQISFEIWGCLIGIVVCLILGASTFRNRDVTGRKLWRMVLVNNIMLICDALAYLYRGDTTMIGTFMTRISNYSMYLMEYVLLFCFIGYTDDLTDRKDMHKSHWKKYAVLLNCIAMLGLLVTPFTGLYFTFDTLNRYRRGPGIWISFAVSGIVFGICIWRLFTCRKQLTKTQKHVFLSCMITFVLCMLLQYVFYGLSLINIALTVCILLMYFMHCRQQYEYIHTLHIEQAIHDTAELVRWRIENQEACYDPDKE